MIEDSREVVLADCDRVVGSLAPRKVSKGFFFPALPLTNLIVVDDFKQEDQGQTYIRAHRRSFNCNPTNSEARWWFESQSRVYAHKIPWPCP